MRPPLGKGQVLELMLAFRIHPVAVGSFPEVAALCYPTEIQVWSDSLGQVSARELAHALAHSLLHTWRDGIYICRRDHLAGDPHAETQADYFARLLVDSRVDRLIV